MIHWGASPYLFIDKLKLADTKGIFLDPEMEYCVFLVRSAEVNHPTIENSSRFKALSSPAVHMVQATKNRPANNSTLGLSLSVNRCILRKRHMRSADVIVFKDVLI